MSKGYLSQGERTQFLFMNALGAELCQTAETYANSKNPDKKTLRLMRTASTFTRQASEAWLATVTTQEHRKLIQALDLFCVGMIPAKDIEKKIEQRHQQEIEMRKRVATDNPDHIKTLAEFAMVRVCTSCNGCIRESCELYPALDAMEIEPYGEYDTCKYAYVEPVQEVR